LAARPSRSHRYRVIIPTGGNLLQVERASPERVTPFCPHFGTCGGCAIQHWETERYRAWKRNVVIETLAQAKLSCDVYPLIDGHGLGRRRITLHARMAPTISSRWALPRQIRTTLFPWIAVPFSIRA